jgi:hypothetical protein
MFRACFTRVSRVPPHCRPHMVRGPIVRVGLHVNVISCLQPQHSSIVVSTINPHFPHNVPNAHARRAPPAHSEIPKREHQRGSTKEGAVTATHTWLQRRHHNGPKFEHGSLHYLRLCHAPFSTTRKSANKELLGCETCRHAVLHIYKTCRLADCRLADCRLADLQTCRLADLQTCRLADLQTCKLADVQTCRRADVQTIRYSVTPDECFRAKSRGTTCNLVNHVVLEGTTCNLVNHVVLEGTVVKGK